MNRWHMMAIVGTATFALFIPSITAGAFLLGIAIGIFFAVQMND